LSALIILKYVNQIDKFIGADVRDTSHNNNKIYFKGGVISTWTLTHFLLFLFLGVICPNNIVLIIILGVLWEMLEFYLEYDRQTVCSKLLCKYVNKCYDKIPKHKFMNNYLGKSNDINVNLYYCSGGYLGQIFDIVANISGYLIGIGINKIVRNLYRG
jgi:hypothetical protein